MSVILPLFYFALYRNRGTLHVPTRLQLLALVIAVLFGMIVAIEILARIESLGLMKSQSVLVHQRQLWSVRDFSTTFAQLSDFAYILLLITIYRQANDECDLNHIFAANKP